MDPLSALSVASSVVQFVQFGCSLVSKGQEIYDSEGGSLLKHVECEEATNRLVELTEKLRPALRDCRANKPAPAGDIGSVAAIEDICDNCLAISKELIALLGKLRVKEDCKRRKWFSFRQALRSVWSKGDLDAIEKRLLACKKELDSHLIANIRYMLHTVRHLISLADERSMIE